MERKNTCLQFILLVLTLMYGCDINKVYESYKPPKELESEENKTFYTIGRSIGEALRNYQLTQEELEVIFKGIADEVKNKDSDVDYNIYKSKVNELLNYKKAQKIAKNIIDFEKTLKSLDESTYKQLDETFYYKIIKKGEKISSEKIVISGEISRDDHDSIQLFHEDEVFLNELPNGIKKSLELIGVPGEGEFYIGNKHLFGLKGSGAIQGGQGVFVKLKTK